MRRRCLGTRFSTTLEDSYWLLNVFTVPLTEKSEWDIRHVLKNLKIGSRGDGSVGRAPATYTGTPEFKSPAPRKKSRDEG